MSYEGFVREIVETYSLAPRLQERIIRIANRRITEMSLNNTHEVYSYVDYLVGRFNRSRDEPVTISLDDKVKHDSKTTFHEIIGTHDPTLVAIQASPPPDSYGAKVSEAFEILRGKLSDTDFAILAQLVHSGMNVFNTDPQNLAMSKDEIIAQLPQIQQRIEAVARTYERDGRIVIPRRPIVYVQFDPVFYVKFGTRRFNGNPLAFFEEHRDFYGRMSRSELSDFDGSLYNSLRMNRQIALAIPDIESELSQEEIDKVVAAHKTYKGNTAEVIRQLGYAQATIVKYWTATGLEAEGRKIGHNKGKKYGHSKRRLPQSSIDRIVESFETYDGNSSEASRNLPYAQTTIARYWKEAGLQARGGPLPPEKIEKIVASHKTYGGNAVATSRKLGYSTTTITKYWNEAGLNAEGQGSNNRLSSREIKRIVASHARYNGNMREAASHLPFSAPTIKKYWGESGLEANLNEGNRLNESEVKRIVRSHRTYNGLVNIGVKQV